MGLELVGRGLSFLHNNMGSKFPQSSNILTMVGQSTICSILLHKAIQNIPYVVFSDAMKIWDIEHMVRSRLSYVESIFISTVLLVYHLMIYTITFVFVILTFGLSEGINTIFKEHSFQTAFSLYSLLISVCGTLFPSMGVYFTALLAKATWEQIVSSSQADFKHLDEPEVVKQLRDGWYEHKVEIRKAFHTFLVNIKFAKDSVEFEKNLISTSNLIDQDVGKARTIHQLTDIVKKFFDGVYSKPEAARL